MSDNDERWMEMAIGLAEKGRYQAHPNPRVGCVIVKDGKLVGSGWHERPGKMHAEKVALAAAGERAEGATVYINLAPCSHHGRTPPCTQALLSAGVKRVVVAHDDPNPVATGGLEQLAIAGIDVTIGPMSMAAKKLNRGFLNRIEKGRPFTIAKLAISADGRTAMPSGESQWISSELSREEVQHLRAQSGAIVTGIGTVLSDDPRLNVRHDRHKDKLQPMRVVIDPKAKLPASAKLFQSDGLVLQVVQEGQTTTPREGKTVLEVPSLEKGLDLKSLWAHLARLEINDILLECGPTLLGAALEQGLVNEMVLYIAPKLFGHGAMPLAILPEIQNMEDHHELNWVSMRKVGPDIELIAEVVPKRG